MTLQEGAIVGPFKETNEENKIKFTLNEADNYGDIDLTFNGLEEDKQYIVELLSENKETVIRRDVLYNNNKLAYKKFETGKYTLRIIQDDNQNGKWDPANVWKHTLQENIWYLNRTFTIRANWEQNETIDVSFQ